MPHLQPPPRTKLSVIAILVAALAWFAEKAEADNATSEGRFQAALDADSAAASTKKPNPAYNRVPLTVELWARLDAKQDYNILVANELKASPTHWEIYTERGPGTYSAYLPGCSPSIIKSPTVLTDGEWHYLAMVFDGHAVRLFVDAKEVVHVQVSRPANLQSVPGSMTFGALVSGSLGCKGLIDEVRISNCIRPITKIPTAPFSADENTVGLWHFDSDQDKAFADCSSTANMAQITPPGLWRKPTPRPHSGPPLAVMPPSGDLAESRRSLHLAIGLLNLASLSDAEQTRDALLADWEEQFFHLANRIAGREKLPAGAAEQAFDEQALVYPSDKDPLGGGAPTNRGAAATSGEPASFIRRGESGRGLQNTPNRLFGRGRQTIRRTKRALPGRVCIKTKNRVFQSAVGLRPDPVRGPG